MTSRKEDQTAADGAGQSDGMKSLHKRFDVLVDHIDVGQRSVAIAHPRRADDLITEADFVKDERMPYWADIWPSSLILARHVIGLEPTGGARRALELGCGSGLVTAAALLAGWEVLATDYYDDSLEFTRENGLANSGRTPQVRSVDWRSFPDDLGKFDLILASDVLYEKAYGDLLATAIAQSLGDRGCALMADPGRIAVDDFLKVCKTLKLRVTEPVKVPFEAGEIRQTISIYEIRR
jgi:ETFB lysine methyltransferase